MRPSYLAMFVLALSAAGGAMMAGNRYLARQQVQQQAPAAVQRATKVVVAKEPLRYGAELTPSSFKEVAWPEEAIPAGAFKSVTELLQGGKRVALVAMEPNEPVLASKITGPGERAVLSALISDGMQAITIKVNEIVGVAGFAVPGSRVDVLLTRQPEGVTTTYTDVVLQNVRVLAAGQLADDHTDKPTVVNTVTLEVDQVAAQKLNVAASAGTLSLALRKAGDVALSSPRRVALQEVGNNVVAVAGPSRGDSPPSTTVTVGVIRALTRTEYSVPVGARTAGLASLGSGH